VNKETMTTSGTASSSTELEAQSYREGKGRMKHILFVDDEANFLDGLRRMLRAQRDVWSMQFAMSVDEALSIVQTTALDVIVSDVTMPIKGGLDLLEALQAMDSTKNIPVIILTGNAEGDLKRRALDLGATDLLNKPVMAEDLLARLRSVLRLKEYQDELAEQNVILERKVRERTIDLDRSRRDILLRLAKAGESRDVETGEHVIRVACCSRILANACKLPSDTVERIFLTSPLHDIGKIGIPDGILLKPGKLTPDERNIMQRHCEIGAAILREKPKGMDIFMNNHSEQDADSEDDLQMDPLREMAVTIALSHHESWDGTGYPGGIKGEAIPYAGRIVQLADLYDALRSARPYKPAYSVTETINIMKQAVGTHTDPSLFELFLTVSSEFEEIQMRFRQ
jgi:putative two-component system response regulator